MKKQIIFSTQGYQDQVGSMKVVRLLPNPKTQAVGPFVFLDNIPLSHQAAKTPQKANGSFAHPHRGIATFSYIMSGETEHYDSRGNHGTVSDGGLQWMKAGNGIIHDENPTVAFQKAGGAAQGMQFWINLPAKNKQEEPEYLAVQAKDVPEIVLENQAGIVRVLIGEYQQKSAIIPQYSPHSLFHIRLQAGKSFLFDCQLGWEYATFLASGTAKINDYEAKTGELCIFEPSKNTIFYKNKSTDTVDIILFGGEIYSESIVAHGPYVMNTAQEITQANHDYLQGKYGKINYN